MHMKDYTLTVRQVLENLATLAHSYETVSRGASPTGNYCFSINVADMAASLKAAQVLISQLPYWISVDERLPDEGQQVLIAQRQLRWKDEMPTHTQSSWYEHEEFCGEADDIPHQCVTHWMPMPEPPGQ
jgi:hypothetical protein